MILAVPVPVQLYAVDLEIGAVTEVDGRQYASIHARIYTVCLCHPYVRLVAVVPWQSMVDGHRSTVSIQPVVEFGESDVGLHHCIGWVSSDLTRLNRQGLRAALGAVHVPRIVRELRHRLPSLSVISIVGELIVAATADRVLFVVQKLADIAAVHRILLVITELTDVRGLVRQIVVISGRACLGNNRCIQFERIILQVCQRLAQLSHVC